MLVPACSRQAEPGMVVQTDSERVRLSRKHGARAPRLVGRPVDGAASAGTWRATTPTPSAIGAAGAACRPRARATRTPPATTRAPDGQTAATVRQPGQGRQRPLRPRLREVHPLLQVRRGVRRPTPEHLRHRRRRARLRRAHLHRVRRAAARLGVRLLRQLHRRVPDRRPDVQAASTTCARPASGTSARRRRPTRSALTAASAARSRCTCRTSGS